MVARKCLPQQAAGSVLEIHPLEVALALEDRERTDRAERRAADVAYHCVSDVPATIPAQPCAIRRSTSSCDAKKVLVEAAEFLEHGLRHQARGTAHAEHS